MTIIDQQPPAQSALARAVAPDDFDRTREVQVLELLAVLVQHTSIKLSSPLPVFDVKPPTSAPDLPSSYPDLFEKPETPEDQILAAMAELDQFLERTTTE